MANSNIHSAQAFVDRDVKKLTAKQGRAMLEQQNANDGARYDDAINHALGVAGIESEGTVRVVDDHGESSTATYVGPNQLRFPYRRTDQQATDVALSLPFIAYCAQRGIDPNGKTKTGKPTKASRTVRSEFREAAKANGYEVSKRMRVVADDAGNKLAAELLRRVPSWSVPSSGKTPGASRKRTTPQTGFAGKGDAQKFVITYPKGMKKAMKVNFLKMIATTIQAELADLG